jgi:hypothetical protein
MPISSSARRRSGYRISERSPSRYLPRAACPGQTRALLRGALAREDYVAAAKNLVSYIKSEPRLEPVASGLNEARFLLEEQKPE